MASNAHKSEPGQTEQRPKKRADSIALKQPAAREHASLWSWDMWLKAWIPVLLIAALHYATAAHVHWAHDVLRRLFYLPILLAAFSRGLRGGLAVSALTTLVYIPHAFGLDGMSMDPTTGLNKALEIVLYNTVGVISGILADREHLRRLQAEAAAEAQRQTAEQLVRAGRLAALGELVAGIAHEIKNPLHTLKGSAEIVDEVIPKDCEQAGMWTLHLQELQRLEDIAKSFLSFARPREPQMSRQTFAEVYQRMGELIKAQAYQVESLRIDILPLSEDLRQTVLEVDRDQIAQIVLNITSNAIKAMQCSPAQGDKRIRVSADSFRQMEQDKIALHIFNNGPKIPEADLERVFDPFKTGSPEDTGLGLSIASRIAEAHQGFLQVENIDSPDEGVSFDLILPALIS